MQNEEKHGSGEDEGLDECDCEEDCADILDQFFHFQFIKFIAKLQNGAYFTCYPETELY